MEKSTKDIPDSWNTLIKTAKERKGETKMRMIIIDAEKKEIREAEYTGLESLQKIVGGQIEDCGVEIKQSKPFCCDCVYVNEEGLYEGFSYGFTIEGGHQPFLGNGVVSGVNFNTGETISAQISVEELAEKITFGSFPLGIFLGEHENEL